MSYCERSGIHTEHRGRILVQPYPPMIGKAVSSLLQHLERRLFEWKKEKRIHQEKRCDAWDERSRLKGSLLTPLNSKLDQRCFLMLHFVNGSRFAASARLQRDFGETSALLVDTSAR